MDQETRSQGGVLGVSPVISLLELTVSDAVAGAVDRSGGSSVGRGAVGLVFGSVWRAVDQAVGSVVQAAVGGDSGALLIAKPLGESAILAAIGALGG